MEWIVEAETLSDLIDHGRYSIASQPLIRCKDCKHKEREQPGMVYCPMMVGSWVADDHFCAWGERRDNGND